MTKRASKETRAAAEPQSGVVKDFRKWLGEVAWLLVPPFDDAPLTRLCIDVRRKLNAEAVSLFLTSESDRNQLRYHAGDGYLPTYESETYYVNSPALTSFVFSTMKSVNLSYQGLMEARAKWTPDEDCPKDAIPPSHNEPGVFLQKPPLKNLIVVPVKFQENPLGVFKIENKLGLTDRQKFPQEDVDLAELLADTIAIVIQQRIYSSLAAQIEFAGENCSDIKTYVNRVVTILRRALNAECCSIWLVNDEHDGDEVQLTCADGVGYRTEYIQDHTYRVAASLDRVDSLTGYIAHQRTLMMAPEPKLSKLTSDQGVKFKGACRSYIESGTFRNILAMALVEDGAFGDRNARCWGVVKLENRLPEGAEFNAYDEALCKQFVTKNIVPTLKALRATSRRRSAKRGVDLLKSRFGRPPAFHSPQDRQEFLRKVLAVMDDEADISDQDCYLYLQVSKATYQRDKAKLLKEDRDSA